MKTKHKKAIKQYTVSICLSALYDNEKVGNGSNTIGLEHGLTTRQADSAINAARYLPRTF